MFCKPPVVWVLPLLFLLFIFPSVVYDIPFTRAQQNNANFITYTNTNLGFTIKHPSDWTVNDRNNNTVNGQGGRQTAGPNNGVSVGSRKNTGFDYQ